MARGDTAYNRLHADLTAAYHRYDVALVAKRYTDLDALRDGIRLARSKHDTTPHAHTEPHEWDCAICGEWVAAGVRHEH